MILENHFQPRPTQDKYLFGTPISIWHRFFIARVAQALVYWVNKAFVTHGLEKHMHVHLSACIPNHDFAESI